MNSVSQNFENIYQVNASYVEDMFARFQSNPGSVSAEWRAYFNGFFDGAKIGSAQGGANAQSVAFELSVAKLVQAYKACGHLKARINPLENLDPAVKSQDDNPKSRDNMVRVRDDGSVCVSARGVCEGARTASQTEIFNLSTYSLADNDLSRLTHAGALIGFPTPMTLENLIKNLETIFCGTIGAEIEHISCATEKAWLYSEFINLRNQPLNIETQKQIYTELARADALEKTIATKYIGKKRFSIEGADAQIVAAESYIDELARLGTKEFKIGIAHRGRLNFLVNLVGKPLANLFAEFEGEPHDKLVGDGDVKYHNGYENVKKTRSGHEVRLGISCNPSHLEYVNPVVMGEVRAIQATYYNSDVSKAAAMVFHGDAALAGQGIVYEAAQLMSLRGYQIGGVVHVVANNQIGFTTNPKDSRSSVYCTSVAYVTESPVFHVNADDLEAVHRIMILAARYRSQFKKDIYIDILCFRRYGHNEGDEPSFTQPVLYKIIKEKPAPYETYLAQLVAGNRFAEADLKTVYQNLRTTMNAVYDKMKADKLKIEQFKPQRDAGKLVVGTEQDILKKVDTSVSVEKLKSIAAKLLEYPNTFHINPKIERLVIEERQNMINGTKPLDWGMAEMLAYASLLDEGFSLRLTGEDTQRGTFSHRHAVLVDIENEKEITPLAAINPKAKTEVINTLLSEEATMGYEYGYSIVAPNTLTLWEGQFGDFVNGAQVLIDQFLVAGETKWCQQQGLTLLLPHGMEGQGAEHSSARLERFLQLCAQGNMQVCYFTQATQIFHALRRQLKRNFRKPLVIMTPKSFLRSPRVNTTLEALAKSQLEEILDDTRITNPASVERVLFCTGKIALDLFDALETDAYKSLAQGVAIVRIEQLYPLHIEKLTQIVSRYSKAKIFAWVQEEPKNMGAYSQISEDLSQIVRKNASNQNLLYFGRTRRATPAVGFEKLHHIEQKQVIQSALKNKESVFI